jgi:hypothetical protein
VQGNTGVQGAQGPTGNTGSQGPQGNTGVQGASGPQGNTGIQGTSGPQGATGAAGVTGIKGPTGLIGDSLASHIQLVTGGWLAAGDATNGIFFGDWTGPGTYGLVGYGGGVKQVEIRAADGILVAGGDNVIIGASGMRFMGGTGSVSWNTQSMTWWRGTERIAREYAYEVDAMTYIDPAQAWRDRYLDIRTESIAPTGQTGRATGFSLNARMDFTGLAGVGYADVHGMAGYDNSYVAVQVQNAKPAANTPPSVIVWDQMVAMHSLLLSPTSGLQNTGGITGPTGSLRYTGDLLPFRNSTAYTGYAFVPLQAPLTSTAWDGDAYSTTAKTIIDMSAVFGLPAGIKAVLASTAIRDSASAAGDCFLVLSPTNSALVGLLTDCSGQTNDSWERDVLIVPCDANGDIYYQIAASGASTMDVYLSFHGYWI